MKYSKRTAEETLKKYLQIFSVIGITGPRQAGKSTLLLHSLPDYTYITFDDYEKRNFFLSDPEKFFNVYPSKIIFDEVQHVPEIFLWIKKKVDEDPETKGKFILTASSQFGFIKGVNESLAGRIGMISLLPFSVKELPAETDAFTCVYKGSYPEVVNQNFEYSNEWYDAYFSTYIERDVQSLTQIGDMRDFQRCVRLLASRIGQELNISSVANEMGVSMPTVKRWISVLEASYILFLLPPYFENFGKRIIKNSKLYFYDTGLAAFLTGSSSQKIAEFGPLAGPLFENFVIADIKKNILHSKSLLQLFFLRTSNQEKIDCIISGNEKTELLEIKLSSTWKPQMTKTIEKFLPNNAQGRLIYKGKNQKYIPQVLVQNAEEFLKDFSIYLGE